MSIGQHHTTEEFGSVVGCGVFDHLHGKAALIRVGIHNLNVGDLFTSE